jgi:hypothetical protein
MEASVYHLVVDGREETREVGEELPTEARRPSRFHNTLQSSSLTRIRRVIAVASSLKAPRATSDLLAEAEAEEDPKGGLGALRMLHLTGHVHARSGGRRQLIWHPGALEGGDPPRLVQRERHMRLRDLLRSGSERWHSTDWLLVEAGFDEDLNLGQAIDETRRTGLMDGLPVNFFRDRGKSGRKYILGALKALYWLESVGWRNYTAQAVEWRWIQPVKERVAPPPLGQPSAFVDRYLTDDSRPSRQERIDARAAELEVEFAGEAQQWIRENYPHAAHQWEEEQSRRIRERQRRRQAELREAATWGWVVGDS